MAKKPTAATSKRYSSRRVGTPRRLKHGRPSVVVLAVEDLEALEDTLELLSDADAMADLREAAAARRTDQTIELTKEEAQARWSRG
jgi:hypothetical protein